MHSLINPGYPLYHVKTLFKRTVPCRLPQKKTELLRKVCNSKDRKQFPRRHDTVPAMYGQTGTKSEGPENEKGNLKAPFS